MLKNTQTDIRWSDYEYDENCTIGEYGCYITAIANILGITPLEFAKKTKGGYVDGLLIHDIAGSLAGYRRVKVDYSEIDDSGSYIIYFRWGEGGYKHFSNVVARENGMVEIYNVYNGETMFVHRERIISCIRIEKL